MPVKSLICPARAFLYSPLGSRASHTSSGASTNTSTKSPGGRLARTASRSARYGLTNAVSVTSPASHSSPATAPTRRMFSSRSCLAEAQAEALAELLAVLARRASAAWRSARGARCRRRARSCARRARGAARSTTLATVLLPQPLRPVNHTTHPRWPLSRSRSARFTACSCQTTMGSVGFGHWTCESLRRMTTDRITGSTGSTG